MAGEALNGLPQQTADERKALLAAVAQYGDAGRQQFEAAKQSVAQSKQAALAGALVGGNPLLDAQIAERVASPFDRATSALGVSQGNHQALLDTIGARGSEAISTLGAAVPLAQAYLQKQYDLQQQAAAARAAASGAGQPSYTERVGQVAPMIPGLLNQAKEQNFGDVTGAVIGRAMGTAADSAALAGATKANTHPQMPTSMGGGWVGGHGMLDPRFDIPGASHGTVTPDPAPPSLPVPNGSGAPGVAAVLGSFLNPHQSGPPAGALGALAPTLGGDPSEIARLTQQLAADKARAPIADPAAGDPNYLRNLARTLGASQGIDPALLYKNLPDLTDSQLATQKRAQDTLASDADAKALASKAGLSEAKVKAFQANPDYKAAIADIQRFIADPANNGYTNDDFMAFIRHESQDPEFTKLLLAVFGHPFTSQSAQNYTPPKATG